VSVWEAAEIRGIIETVVIGIALLMVLYKALFGRKT